MSFRVINIIDKEEEKTHDPIPKTDHLTQTIEDKYYFHKIHGIQDYDPIEIVYDKNSKTWIMVKQSEIFNYT